MPRSCIAGCQRRAHKDPVDRGREIAARLRAGRAFPQNLAEARGQEGAPTASITDPRSLRRSAADNPTVSDARRGRSASDASRAAAAREANPQKRLIQPAEIGALARFLCREEARGITMQDLTVSGGSLW